MQLACTQRVNISTNCEGVLHDKHVRQSIYPLHFKSIRIVYIILTDVTASRAPYINLIADTYFITQRDK